MTSPTSDAHPAHAVSTAHWQGRRLPVPAAWPVRSSPAAGRRAIISAGLAPVLLTGAYLIAGILQPASYSPVRTTISVMAGQAGTDRWVMTGGIVLTGGCYLVTAAGLTSVRAPARALLIVAGTAGIGIAASPESARGTTPRHLAWTVLGAGTLSRLLCADAWWRHPIGQGQIHRGDLIEVFPITSARVAFKVAE